MAVNWQGSAVLARVRLGAQRGIAAATEDVRSEIIGLVLKPGRSGRLYRRRSVVHRASAPGEAPAPDTGRLVNSIRADFSRLGELVGAVVASTRYAAALEFGTSRMAARPYMRPGLAAARGRAEAAVARAVRAALA